MLGADRHQGLVRPATTDNRKGTMRINRLLTIASVTAAVTTGGTGSAAAATSVTRAPVIAFQAAGDVGGGVLEAGTTYAPTTHGFATLKRGGDWVQINIQTSGLPAGAYTVWWVVFGTPDGCVSGCGSDDLFNPDAQVSIFWATGGVIRHDGAGNFVARHHASDDLGEPGSQHVLGDGSLDPSRAEIHNIIKYHGPASDDPALLYEQTHTLLGGCFEHANAVDMGEPFGVQCFDPQAVAHPRP
jgi:hypothetical protein